MRRMQEFLGLLYVAPITLFTAVLPIIGPLSHHVKAALTISQTDTWAKTAWWDWFGSWIFFGGPFGRWIIGTILGYRLLRERQNPTDVTGPGEMVERPHLRILVAASLGFLLSLFALVNFHVVSCMLQTLI